MSFLHRVQNGLLGIVDLTKALHGNLPMRRRAYLVPRRTTLHDELRADGGTRCQRRYGNVFDLQLQTDV